MLTIYILNNGFLQSILVNSFLSSPNLTSYFFPINHILTHNQNALTSLTWHFSNSSFKMFFLPPTEIGDVREIEMEREMSNKASCLCATVTISIGALFPQQSPYTPSTRTRPSSPTSSFKAASPEPRPLPLSRALKGETGAERQLPYPQEGNPSHTGDEEERCEEWRSSLWWWWWWWRCTVVFTTFIPLDFACLFLFW